MIRRLPANRPSNRPGKGTRVPRTLAVLALVPIALASCGRAKPPAGEAHAAAEKAYRAAATPAEKVAILREFLATYPESEHTLDALRPAVYYLVERLDAAAEAEALVRDLLEQVQAPAIRREVLLARLEPLAALGDAATLATTVAAAIDIAPLDYAENDDAVDAALRATAWPLALERAEAGLLQAGPDAVRADFPDRTFTDDEIREAVARRWAAMLAGKGWALANLERPDEALAALAEAAEHDTPEFTGDSANRIGSYRGRILLRLGRHREALQALAADALFGGDEDALTAMREAYVALHGGDTGLDAYLWSTRLAAAPRVPDFELPDYQGRPRAFSSLRGGEVTLLAFWFPT